MHTLQVGVAMQQVNQFKRAWMNYNYTYTKEYESICAGQLVDLLKELPPPLGVGSDGSYYDAQILAKKVQFGTTITHQWVWLNTLKRVCETCCSISCCQGTF